jgi:hypothetical protein
MEGITGLMSNGNSGQPATSLDTTALGTPPRGEDGDGATARQEPP